MKQPRSKPEFKDGTYFGEIVIARKVYFSSGIRYFKSELSEEDNFRLFGPSSRTHGHGYNFTLEGFFQGPIDPVTGLVVNLSEIDPLMKKVVAKLDHKHLSFDVEAFKTQLPTPENIARFCYLELEKESCNLSAKLLRVRLYQGADVVVNYPSV